MNNFNYIKKRRKKLFASLNKIDFERVEPLKIEIIHNGYIVPPIQPFSFSKLNEGGVFDENLNFVEISRDTDFGKMCKFNSDNAKYIDEKIIYFGVFIKQWGHFISDCISRLWVLINEKYKDYKVAFIPIHNPFDFALNGQFLELLELLGVDNSRLIAVDSISKFKEIVVPERSLVTHSYSITPYFTKNFIQMIDKLVLKCLNDCNPDVYKNDIIYIAHDVNSSLKDVNNKAILKSIEQIGAKIISPSQLSFKDQVRFLNFAKTIILDDGTIPHNIIFALNNIEVIILNKFNFVNNRQLVINNMKKNLQIIPVDTYLQFFRVGCGTGPFFYYPTRSFEKMMLDKFGFSFSTNKHFLSNFIRYTKFYLKTWSFRLTKKLFYSSPIEIHRIIVSQKKTTKRLLKLLKQKDY